MTDIPADVIEAAATICNAAKFKDTASEEDCLVAIARAILADRAAQAERMARLEEALKPFAYVADVEDEAGRDDPDDDRIWVVQAHGCQLAEFTIDDFRRARALSQEGSDA